MPLSDPIRPVRRLMWSLGLCLVLGACAATPGIAPLAGSEWRLSHLDGQAVLAHPPATLLLGTDGRLSGHGACNRFTGSYQLQGDRLRVGPVAATRIGCPGPVGQQENRYLQALQGARQVQLQQDGALLIRGASGEPVLRFLPASP
ncbi:MAG: META domain-containing protein [Gammaproteobacteria bacterium]